MGFAAMSLDEIAAAASAQRLPPVASWNPARCGHSGIRITADGSWIHEGRPVPRPELVKLFASILRREPDGRYVLVTPAEKLDIDVDDAPLLAVELKSEGVGGERRLAFRLNTGELVVAGPGHPLRLRQTSGECRPYLEVRDGIEARVERGPYYELAELALGEAGDPLGLWSDGAFFPLSSE